MSTGATYPGVRQQYGAADADARFVHPGQHSSTGGDLATNAATVPSFTINASNSLIEKICPTCSD